MSDNDREEKKENPNLKNSSEVGERAQEENLSEESSSPPGIKILQDEIELRKQEYNDLYSRYLLIAADFDNYRKRVTKEKTDITTYGNEELIKELLHVLDNLERALEHSESDEDIGPVIEGIKLVYKQFLNCLEKFGVKPINAHKGGKFDPKYHQAIERVESSEITPGLILSEALKGYMLKDRLLRPSLVVVSKEKDESSIDSGNHETGNSGSEEVLDLLDEESGGN
jgi:molecular chaperone GrpE